MAVKAQDYSEWLNKAVRMSARIEPQTVRLMAATLNDKTAFNEGDALPPAWHWLYFHAAVKGEDLDADGHEKLGRFIPPLPFQHRMWAGGNIDFHAPLRIGQQAEKTSRVESVTLKTGKSGELYFVNVRHEICVDSVLCIDELQTIVYRKEIVASATAPAVPDDFPKPQYQQTWRPDAAMLFRYSALTFNAHRIHYDTAYCKNAGYENLIVHGPLNATLLLRAQSHYQPDKTITSFKYAAKSPLFVPRPMTVRIAPVGDDVCKGWVCDEQNRLITTADFTTMTNPR